MSKKHVATPSPVAPADPTELAERLTRDYGSGFSHSGLTRMVKLCDCLLA